MTAIFAPGGNEGTSPHFRSFGEIILCPLGCAQAAETPVKKAATTADATYDLNFILHSLSFSVHGARHSKNRRPWVPFMPAQLELNRSPKVTTEKLDDIIFPQTNALRGEQDVPRGDSTSRRGREGLVDHQLVRNIALLEDIRERRDGRGSAIVFRHHEQRGYRGFLRGRNQGASHVAVPVPCQGTARLIHCGEKRSAAGRSQHADDAAKRPAHHG